MLSKLRNNYIFGPITSRRLGISLGVNVLPNTIKICNFNCVYCECGWNSDYEKSDNLNNKFNNKFPTKEEIKTQLEETLLQLSKECQVLDTITFSGNGEPTLNPEFSEIIDDTILLRNKYFSNVKISVLSNSTMLQSQEVVAALKKIDNPILKLDSANIETLKKINLAKNNNVINNNLINNDGIKNFSSKNTVEKIIDGMKRFGGDFILQIMFLRGENNGDIFDNTTDMEISNLLTVMQETQPRQVMIYPIDRETPAKNLIKLDKVEMERIAEIIKNSGFNVTYV